MFIVFAYDFSHQKSAQVLLNLVARNLRPDLVIGAPHQTLRVRKRLFVERMPPHVIETRELCRQLGLSYLSSSHSSDDLVTLLSVQRPQLGLIAGARIIPKRVLENFSTGVLNVHPGLLPSNRGLFNVEWAVLNSVPQGVTAHLIDATVDGGQVLHQEILCDLPKRLETVYTWLSALEIRMLLEQVPELLSDQARPLMQITSGSHHAPLKLRQELYANLAYNDYRRRYRRIVEAYKSSNSKLLG